MKFQKYKKEETYSYTLGAFPTLELIKTKKETIIAIFIHPSFNNQEVINKIYNNVDSNLIFKDEKIFSKLSNKENVYIIGIFKKYEMHLDKNMNHVLLDNPSDMGNLGTIIRSSLGFDFLNIAIIEPGVDIFNPKVIRASMGSFFLCNIEYFHSLEDYLKKYSEHTLYSFMLQTDIKLSSFKFDKNKLTTLAFGNEAHGLDKKYLKYNPIIIKHSALIDSLNITNALTIALYEFDKQIKE